MKMSRLILPIMTLELIVPSVKGEKGSATHF